MSGGQRGCCRLLRTPPVRAVGRRSVGIVAGSIGLGSYGGGAAERLRGRASRAADAAATSQTRGGAACSVVARLDVALASSIELVLLLLAPFMRHLLAP